MNASVDQIALVISSTTDTAKLALWRRLIHDRERVLAQVAGASVKPGDTVKFADAIRPGYLKGLTAKVVRCNQTTVTVECPKDLRYGKFSGLPSVRLPMTLIGEVNP